MIKKLILLSFGLLSIGFAQQGMDQTIQLSRAEMRVSSAFAEISQETDLVFSYGKETPLETELTFAKQEAPVEYFMDVFSRTTGFSYTPRGKKVLISPPAEKSSPVTATKKAEKVTLSGYMRNASNGEDLLYARVGVIETGTGVLTNEYGFYSLTLPPGQYTVSYSYLGFKAVVKEIDLQADTRLDIELQSEDVEIETVVITGEADNENIVNTDVGVVNLDVDEIKTVPVVFGERDIIKTIQLMPGVSGVGEGFGGLYVRGGGPDQNLMLLDEAPVYNASHLLGFFSVFNSDALKDMKLYKGGVPARYGGRSSSVFDIRMKEGNLKEFHGTGGIGIIASRLALEGPIKKDKGSFLVAGRRTYADVFTAFAKDTTARNAQLYFYDLNLKANYKIGEKDRVYLSGYFGRDVLGLKGSGFSLDWGNATGTLRWNHLYSDKLFANTTFIFSNYDYSFGFNFDDNNFGLSAGIRDFNLKEDFSYFLNDRNTIRFGVNAIHHTFKPGQFELETPDTTFTFKVGEKQALESGIFLSNEQKIGDRITLNYGLRGSMINLMGPDAVFRYDSEGNVTDTVNHSKGEFYKTYAGIEPRFAGTFLLNESSSIKASYGRMYQYIHLLSNSVGTSPTDYWIPTSEIIKPRLTDQVSVGYFHNFFQNKLQVSVETYYKNMQNEIDYKDGASLFFNDQYESELVFGKGRSYGVEFLVRKRKGKFTGWVSYTLSRSQRQFEDINKGEWYSARQDRIHDLSVVLAYEFNKRISANVNWVYYTGDAITLPGGKYEIEGNVVSLYSERNANRFEDYHRMDVGLNFILSNKGWLHHDLNLSCYNVYNRRNPWTYDFRESETNPNQTEVVKISLYRAVPSVTWNFEF